MTCCDDIEICGIRRVCLVYNVKDWIDRCPCRTCLCKITCDPRKMCNNRRELKPFGIEDND